MGFLTKSFVRFSIVYLLLFAFFLAVLFFILSKILSPETFTSSMPALVMAGALGLGIFAAAGLFLNLRFSKRVHQLIQEISRMGKGKIPTAKQGFPENELESISEAASHMARALSRKISAIEEEKNKLAGILHHMTEGVLGVDQDLQVLIANPSAAAMLDIPLKQIAGKSLIETTRHHEIEDIMLRAMKTGRVMTTSFEISYPEKKFLQASAVGVGASEGGICGILVFYDMTEIRNLENTRREFVANVSHELRTPLTSIKGFIETLLEGALKDPERSAHFLNIMQEDTERLARLIDDLLELSSLESGQTRLKLQPVSIKDEIEKALAALEPRLLKKNITVEKKIPAGVPQISADRDKLKQVLLNLLDNAIKFNRDGGRIIISASLSNGNLEVGVSDTGSGIPAEAVDRVFERFFRVDKARSRDAGGTGLGLAIVKHIVEAHSGRVSCENAPGQGALFKFYLPLKA